MERIAHVSLHGDPLEPLGSIEAGGQNVYVRNMATELARAGTAVDVFTRWNSPEKPRVEQICDGARVIRLRGGPKSFVKKEKTVQFLPEMLDDFINFSSRESLQYRLIHTHYYIEGAFGLEACRRTAAPQAHTFHSLGRVKLNHELLQANPDLKEYGGRLEIERDIMRNSNLLVATSPFEAEDFSQWYDHDNSNVFVVPCGLDPAIFWCRDRLAMRSKLGLPPDRKTITYVGRLDPRKGIETLLFAYRKMLYDFGTLHRELLLVIVGGDPRGNDPELKHYHQLATELQIPICDGRQLPDAGCVLFVGAQPQETVAEYYSAADVVAVPSYYEPFGMVAIEAQACGTPVVCSAVGGLRHAVAEHNGGLWAKPYSAENLCTQLDIILRNNSFRAKLASSGQKRVQTLFTWEAVGRQLSRAYSKIPGAIARPKAMPRISARRFPRRDIHAAN